MTDSTSFDTEFDSLTSATAERAALRADAERSDKLGVVIGGSLSEGLDVKLDRDVAWRSWPWAATWWREGGGRASSA